MALCHKRAWGRTLDAGEISRAIRAGAVGCRPALTAAPHGKPNSTRPRRPTDRRADRPSPPADSRRVVSVSRDRRRTARPSTRPRHVAAGDGRLNGGRLTRVSPGHANGSHCRPASGGQTIRRPGVDRRRSRPSESPALSRPSESPVLSRPAGRRRRPGPRRAGDTGV